MKNWHDSFRCIMLEGVYMEPDRYQKHHVLFIIGLVSLLSSLILIFFSAFLLPHLLFAWQYNVPEFIFFWRESLTANYGLTFSKSSQYIFLFFFLLAVLFGIVAYIISKRIDDEIYYNQLPVTITPNKSSQNLKEFSRYFFHVLWIVTLVALALLVVHLFVSV